MTISRYIVLVISLTSLGSGALAQAKFQFFPRQPFMDDRISIRITGLPRETRVTITTKTEFAGYRWTSSADYTSNGLGVIDLEHAAPIQGDYRGIDGMGLFRSMKLDTQKEPSGNTAEEESLAPVTTYFTAEAAGRPVASIEIRRLWTRPSVRITDIREQGFVGRIFEPASKGKHPAMLVLSGSEGGIKNWDAANLAAHGYTVFALAYFKMKGLPDELIEIPLEYLKRGIDLLRSMPSVDADRLGVMGGSKGGELSLLLASTYSEIKAVVAYNSGALIGPGIDEKHLGNRSSWTLGGKPIPFARCKPTPEFTAQFRTGGPLRLLPLNGPCLTDKEATAGALIPVERIKGAVMLVTGGDDQTGPSTDAANLMIATIAKRRNSFRYEHLSYPSAGHGIYNAYLPMTMSTGAGHLALGGTPEANGAAQADSWPRVLRFLRETLRASDKK